MGSTCLVTYTPATNFFGNATFKYRVLIADAIYGSSILSSAKTVTLNVFPRPHGTGLPGTVSAVQKSAKTVTFKSTPWTDFKTGTKLGYSHAGARFASRLKITDFNNTLIQLPNATCNEGICYLTCDPANGDCNLTVSPVGDYFGTTSFRYTVFTRNPVTNEEVESQSSANVNIQFYPLPVPTALMNKRIPESAPRKVRIALGTGLGYTQDYNEPASSVDIVSGSIKNGSLTAFSCSSSTVSTDPNYGVCEATFTPTEGYIGTDAGFRYRVTVRGLQSTLEGEYRLEIYPVPKPRDISFMAVQNDALDTTKNYVDIILKRGTLSGGAWTPVDAAYSHAYNQPVNSVFVLGVDSSQGTLTPFTCDINSADGRCTARFTPADDFYGNVNINYLLRSDEVPDYETPFKRISIEVYPKPVASGLNLFARENTDEVFQISHGSGYSHPYGHRASTVQLEGSPANGLVLNNDILCEASGTGICSGVFKPSTNYFGNASFDYRVSIVKMDTLRSLPITLTSHPAGVQFNVRPRPRTTGRSLAVVEGTQVIIPLDIGAAVDKKGYTHPIPADFSGAQISTSNVTNGTVIPETECTLAGLCEMRFIPSTETFYGPAQFTYNVGVNDTVMGDVVESSPIDPSDLRTERVEIDYRPKPKGTGKTLNIIAQATNISPYPFTNTFEIKWSDGYTYPAAYPRDSIVFSVVPGSESKGTVSAINCVDILQVQGCCVRRKTCCGSGNKWLHKIRLGTRQYGCPPAALSSESELERC